MTPANLITIFRILMVPVFVYCGLRYASTANLGSPEEFWRWSAIAVFAVAALTDALDGWVARRFDQTTRLGSFLDPVADKSLMLAAILTLSLANWGQNLPIWYAALVIARDLILVSGAIAIGKIAGDIRVIPHVTGKLATALQIALIGVVFFRLPDWAVLVGAVVTSVFTIWSAALYIAAGMGQLPHTPHGSSHHLQNGRDCRPPQRR